MRRLAAIVALVAWITCYVQCVGRLSGVEIGGDPCCSHDHQEQPGKESKKECGVCDAFNSGGVEVTQPFLILDALLVVVAITLSFVAFFIPIPRLLEACQEQAARWRSWTAVPRRIVPLWELLARTALPVRGPSLALA